MAASPPAHYLKSLTVIRKLHSAVIDAGSELSSLHLSAHTSRVDYEWASELNCELQDLRQAFHHLDAEVSREYNRVVPVNSLPPEILAEIFSHGNLHTTIIVSWVCHDWRVIALTTTTLWKAVNLMQWNGHTLNLILERSGGTLLDLDFRCGDQRNVRDKLIHTLLAFPERIERVHSLLHVPIGSLSSDLLMPNLRLLNGIVPIAIKASRLNNILANIPRLYFLRLNFEGERLLFAPKIATSLHTLILSQISASPNRILKTVAKLLRLEQLYLIGSGEEVNSGGDEVYSAENKLPPSLTILVLERLPPTFVDRFYRELDINHKINLHVGTVALKGKSSEWEVKRAPKAVWIDLSDLSVIYKRFSGLIRVPLLPGRFAVYSIPTLFPIKDVKTLYVTHLSPDHSVNISAFVGLEKIVLEYSHGIYGRSIEGFHMLDQDLVRNCPRLRYIGIVIPDPAEGEGVVKDYPSQHEIGLALSAFLDEWTLVNISKFSTIHIQHTVEADQWRASLPSLQRNVISIEIGPLSYPRRPEFPQFRQFI